MSDILIMHPKMIDDAMSFDLVGGDRGVSLSPTEATGGYWIGPFTYESHAKAAVKILDACDLEEAIS